MSDLVLLESVLEAKAGEYPDGLDVGEVFEIFVADTILKNYGLSYSELDDGVVDGSKDGGIDSVYHFVNGVLVTEDFDFSNYKGSVVIESYVFQSKRKDKFEENAVNRLHSSLPELFDLSKSEQALEPLYNAAVRNKFSLLKAAFSSLAATFPAFHVHVYYACRGKEPSGQMKIKANKIGAAISDIYSDVKTNIVFLGAGDLYNAARAHIDVSIELPVFGSPLNVKNAYVALVRLSDYNTFISSDNQLSERLFEFNVRDYEGGVQVNKQIRKTLDQNADGIDFWWLNNGVTILAEKAVHQNNALVLQSPVIVNGLQTSNEIYNHFSDNDIADDRNVLVRVVQTDTDIIRDAIIKATNSQTRIKASSLRATEEIQRRIEDYLKIKSIYYDRRKNYYKNRGKPGSQIIGIDRLAQAVMSILLQRPDSARARPGTIIKDDDQYTKMFSVNYDMGLYEACAQLNFIVEKYFRHNRKSIDSIYRNNLRFHTMMVLAWNLLGTKSTSHNTISGIEMPGANDSSVSQAFDWVRQRFDETGAEDSTAKDNSFVEVLKDQWQPL